MPAAQRGALKPQEVSRKEEPGRIFPSTSLLQKTQETGVKVTGGWFEGLCTKWTVFPAGAHQPPWSSASLYPGTGSLGKGIKHAKLQHLSGTGGFSDSLLTYEAPYVHLGGYLFPALWSVKLPEGEEMLNEIYILRKQRDNLCCAVERGCCHIIIKLRCAGQM